MKIKKIYVVRKYVQAESVEEALIKEKKIAPVDVWLTEYSTTQHLESLSPSNHDEERKKRTPRKVR